MTLLKPPESTTTAPGGGATDASATDTSPRFADVDTCEGALGIERSILSRLPLELRQQIYGFVLGAKEFVVLTSPPRNYIHDVCGFPDYRPRKPALLRTCRQIHTEAADILYQCTTFTVSAAHLLPVFAERNGPLHFNKICHLCIGFVVKSESSCSYHESLDHLNWETFCSTVTSITHLRTLRISVTYMFHFSNQSDDDRYCRPILEPLLALSGLQEFHLRLTVGGRKLWKDYRETLIIQLSDPLLALIKKIKEAAARPRMDAGGHPRLKST